MRGAIVYAGKYGSTRQYSQWLAETTAFELIDLYLTPRPDLQAYTPLLLGSSVIFGRLRIAAWLRRHWNEIANRSPVLFSVSGLAPGNPLLRAMVQLSLGPGLFRQLTYFALPGRLIYTELDTLDRFLLASEARLGLKLGSHPEHYLSRGGDFNHVSRQQLTPLLEYLHISGYIP